MNGPVQSVSAFFPCYNDERTIIGIVEAALGVCDRNDIDGEVIVVDDGSTDGSAKLLADLAVVERRLRIVTHDVNRGYGAALLSGFHAATKQWVFYTDGDGQYDPRELESFLQLATEKVDVVQGFKLSRSDNLVRRVIGRVYHHCVSLMFALDVRDTDCDFRLIRRSTLGRIDLLSESGAICVELVRKLQDVDAQFVEAPVHHYPRQYGRSQFFRPVRVFKSLADLARLWVRLVAPQRDRAESSVGAP